ncbi:MAG TPA: ATP-dependent DNA helicase [Rhodospirillaceae bacterium]|nr:ATP-dependent DNA helicase [Rhodospirillaceae bacterium]
MTDTETPTLILPAAPALVVHPRGAVWLACEGEIADLSLPEALRQWQQHPPLLCHRPAVVARLGTRSEALPALDVLELFAFVHPARFAVPTIRGLAEALDLEIPTNHHREAASLMLVATCLLRQLARSRVQWSAGHRRDICAIAWLMSRQGWPWAPAVLAALGTQQPPGGSGLRIWERLAEWSEHAPPPPAGDQPVNAAEARARLALMLGDEAEERPSQADFASAGALAFAPRQAPATPWVVLAEAGTGTGKTLGYVAPASVWAEKNQGPVWISTYTRNLQRQLDSELNRLYPDPVLKARRVVIRKGRENYLCLLNFEEAVQRLGPGESAGGDAVALGLMARWALASRDGDMIGGDLPGWLVELLGRSRTLGLADRRGECIYSACPHFRKCFIERTIRRAKRAHLVIANHALVLMMSAFRGLEDSQLPTRYVFDEGHHLFAAADDAFSASLSGLETAELRRWLLGGDGEARKSRARGLRRRIEDLLEGHPDSLAALDQLLQAVRQLPSTGWLQRLAEDRPLGLCESFLGLLRQEVYARAAKAAGTYSIECEPSHCSADLISAAGRLANALDEIALPVRRLTKDLNARLDAEAADLDSASRQRIEAIMRGLEHRALAPLSAWTSMLADLGNQPENQFVDWFAVDRQDGRDVDVGLHRHWVDPMRPFAKVLAEPAHGLLITSATLRDGSGDQDADWEAAERRSGTLHLPAPAVRAAVPSPFDYPTQTRVLVVTDVRKDDLDQVAAAYRELFLAAGGGGLGLFTAVVRLREVWRRIVQPLDQAGLRLLAQHVDGMDIGTLIDIFRAEEDACLLGTDAVRDGVDVPGRSLRLIVFDRVPWPRPDILHKARRTASGQAKAYDDMITRLRLKQAFGRLIRRSDDAGVFVLLDPLMPSRLAGAFPSGVAIQRVGLADAVGQIRTFLATD